MEQESTTLKSTLEKTTTEFFDVKTQLTKTELEVENLHAQLETEQRRVVTLTSQRTDMMNTLRKKDTELVEAVAMITELKSKLGVGSGGSGEGSDAYMKARLSEVEKRGELIEVSLCHT